MQAGIEFCFLYAYPQREEVQVNLSMEQGHMKHERKHVLSKALEATMLGLDDNCCSESCRYGCAGACLKWILLLLLQLNVLWTL